MEFPDGSNIYYDFDKDKQISLPDNWTDFDFNGNGNEIAFKDMHPIKDYRYLGIASPDGSKVKYLEPIGGGEDDIIVDISPNDQVVGMYNKGFTGDTTKMYFIGKNDENFKSVVINGYGVETQWTPDGNNLLYSAHNHQSEHKPLLHIVKTNGNEAGSNHLSLNLNTWAYKCSFQNNKNLFCAVPRDLPKGADYDPSIANNTPDDFYKINLKTGNKTFIAQPENDFTVEQLKVDKNGKKLFFTDKHSKALHEINLK